MFITKGHNNNNNNNNNNINNNNENFDRFLKVIIIFFISMTFNKYVSRNLFSHLVA